MKYIVLIVIGLFAGCATADYRYEVHLIEGGGSHHLITTETEDEALDFLIKQEDSHGAMEVMKIKN
jgi:hypothetical protein|tara:strand:+ start:678 stop:875 length:198 start_codon:yes stop_codon:yes gene_type:complete